MEFELLLFAAGPRDAAEAAGGGVDGLIVDWERSGKTRRQASADTEVNDHTLEDLRSVAAASTAPVVCRLDGPEPSCSEVEVALAEGARELLLPMVSAPEQVERVLEHVGDRCGVGILVETNAAVESAGLLAKLPLTRVYLGLNDLAIERRSPSIFEAVLDGTLERVREDFRVPFGFGGLTLPRGGRPIRCGLLIGEMMRLRCSLAFLRRSYRRDLAGAGGHREAIAAIRAGLAQASHRPPERVEEDRVALRAAISAIGAGGAEAR